MKISSKLLLLIIWAFSAGLNAEGQGDDPATLVSNTTNRIFNLVADNLETYEANPESLRALVRTDLIPLLDVHYSARLILGRAGRGIEKEKVDAFAEAMINLLVNRYSTGLLHFGSKDQLLVLPQRGELNEKLTRVRTRVRLPKGGEAPILSLIHI